ncbi:MAG: DUF1153 domain-containing protein [Litoreibacter sp.]|nr:DUF1153 domain-containing protein [Litoreibacter sp.]
MYLRRSSTPRMVTLPDGSTLTRADLPDPDTRRWVASRKAAVVKAVDHGLLDAADACEIYGLSQEELESWQKAVSTHGINALKTTSLQNYRLGEGVSPHLDDR